MSFAFFRARVASVLSVDSDTKGLLWGQWGGLWTLPLQSDHRVLLLSCAFLSVRGEGGVAEHSASNNRTRLT